VKILYDHQAFGMQQFGGVSNCFVQLIKNLPQNCQHYISLCESDNVHLIESGLNVSFKPRKLYEENFISNRKFKGRGFLYRCTLRLTPWLTSEGINRKCSIEALKRGNFDVFHPTYFHPYFLKYLNGKPFILTVHDMIPELFSFKRDNQIKWKKLLCNKAAHIVAVSENTKQDLIKILNVPNEKVTVIYHGAPEYPNNIDSPPIINGEYILYVGQRELYKNFLSMVKALTPVLQRHQYLKIVCTGAELTRRETSALFAMGMTDRVQHLRVSDDRSIMNLYSHALCFIYPSAYEGFGIPILEAYKANCPVLLNNKSCFPEIANDAAIYFNLDDSHSDLESVMETFLRLSSEERLSLLAKQRQRLSLFSWQKSANQLADIYRLASQNCTPILTH